MRTIADKPGTLYLGKQGEHLARELAFREPGVWAEEFGTGIAQLLVRPTGGPAYPVALAMEDGLAVWRITAADTARAGYGCCELRWSMDDMIVRSKRYTTYVSEGLSGGCGCGGDNWSAYLEQIARAGAEALAAAGRAESAALHAPAIRDGTWWVWDPEAGGYTDTGVAATGDGGGCGCDIATDEEVREMLDEVFGAAAEEPDDIATDAEINEMLNEVFGPRE